MTDLLFVVLCNNKSEQESRAVARNACCRELSTPWPLFHMEVLDDPLQQINTSLLPGSEDLIG